MREQVSTEGLKNMINFKKGSGESESPSSANSTSPTQPGSTSGKDTKLITAVTKEIHTIRSKTNRPLEEMKDVSFISTIFSKTFWNK